MPLFFNLYRKGAPEGSAPVSAIALDTEICALFGAEPDQHYYFAGWFDSIGLRLAQRQTWDEIRAKFTEARAAAIAGGDLEYAEVYTTLLKIVDYLEAGFTAEGGRCHK